MESISTPSQTGKRTTRQTIGPFEGSNHWMEMTMKNVFFAALAALGVVLGAASLTTEANAAWVPNGHGYSFQEQTNG